MPPRSAAIHACSWNAPQEIASQKYVCGYCGHKVASNKGYSLVNRGDKRQHKGVYICPDCQCPTFHYPDADLDSVPGRPFGNAVSHAPDDLSSLYEEARTSTANGCFTGAVLLLRKMLMNIAVNKGAPEGQTFVKYVDFLEANHFVPPNSRDWVDHVRKKGNEATHEIQQMKSDDAQDLIVFVEMMLKFIYEFPAILSTPRPT